MHESTSNGLSALLLAIEDATEQDVRRAVDLSPRELAALVLLVNRTGCTVGWLHQRLGLTQSGAVRLVDRLEELRLVRRTRQPGRRTVSLTITSHGESVVQQGVQVRTRAIEQLLSGLGEDEQQTFLALAERALATRPRSRDEGDEVCRLCDWGRCTPTCPVDGWSCTSEDAGTAGAPAADAS
jgi:DNA-binding MarR family transcriptional regulator